MSEASHVISPGYLADELDGLRIRLSTLGDNYARLFEVRDFLADTLRRVEPAELTEPYLLELHDELLAATAFRTPPEVSPDRLSGVLQEIRYWRQWAPASLRKGWDLVLERIEQEVLVSAALVGDFRPALDMLEVRPEEIEPSHDPGRNARLLRKLVEVSRPGWSDAIERRLRRASGSGEDGTSGRFPAVYAWSERDAQTRSASRGFLCQASFRIWKAVDGSDDLSIQSGGNADLDDQILAHVSTAGRRMLQELAPESLEKGYRGSFSFQTDQVRLEGGSMRALLAVLYALEVIRFRDRRVTFQLDAGTVISGDMDVMGVLHPVEEGTVVRKVEAAFFSQATQLVLPREHRESARQTLDLLQEAYPLRRLSILAVDSIFDIFADRRVVYRHEKSRSRFAAEQTWKHRSRLMTTSVALLLMFVSFTLFFRRVDPHIVGYHIDPESAAVNFLNGEQEVVRSVRVGHVSMSDMLAGGARHVTIGDINADGFNDAFWVIRDRMLPGAPGVIKGMDGATGDSLFNFVPDFELRYPNDLSISINKMWPQDIALHDTNGDGKLELLATFEHIEYYPSILAAIDPLTQDVLQRYDHPGALRDMLVVDVTGDGKAEILIGGANNSMRMPVFLVLDPADFSDTGPFTRSSYEALPKRIGKELAYFTFPESPISRFNSIGIRLADLIISEEDGNVLVSISDTRIESDAAVGLIGSYRITFDNQLRPISMGTSSNWDVAYDQAHEQGLVPAEFTNEMKLHMLANVQRLR